MNATEELLAREHIRNVIYSYCRAVDSRDWDAVRACFASNATICLLYTSPSPRDRQKSRMPSSA